MLLERFPRVSLSHAPTPLEPLVQLRRAIGGPRLWIKRDDCTGLAQGGNKARKLEFLLADALAKGCKFTFDVTAIELGDQRASLDVGADGDVQVGECATGIVTDDDWLRPPDRDG